MNMYTYCRNNSLNYVDPSGLILRNRKDGDVINAVIFTGHGHTYGLVGDWDIEDVYGRFSAQPQEITTYNINGMTVFVEEDDGAVHLINPYPNNSSLVSVWLDATNTAYYRDAVIDAEPIAPAQSWPIVPSAESPNYWREFWVDVAEWCDIAEYCMIMTQDMDFRKKDDMFKHMYISYEMSEMGGPWKSNIVGLGNEVLDTVLGEGFNIGDMLANQLGIQEQQDGTLKGDAEVIFEKSAPLINGILDTKVKVYYIPYYGTWIIVR